MSALQGTVACMLLFLALPFVVALLIMLRLGARIRFVPLVVWRAAS